MEPVKTTDICDAHEGEVQVVRPVFRDYGGRRAFAGRIATVRAPDDNSLVRAALEAPGHGRVLVVDGGASLECALVGGSLAVLALEHGWSGLVVNGCVRDADELAAVDVGVKALATHPRRSIRRGAGERDVVLSFAGVTFRPGEWICADPDGIVVLAREPAR